MDEKNRKPIQHFILDVQPLLIFSGMFTYLLGAAIPKYLGMALNTRGFFLGLTLVLLALVIGVLYHLYFVNEAEKLRVVGVEWKALQDKSMRMLASIAVALVLCVLIVFVMLGEGGYGVVTYVFLGIMLALTLLAAISVHSEKYAGFSRVIEAVLAAFIIPGFGLSLTLPALHVLFPLLSVPLVVLFFACDLALELEQYAADLKAQRFSLMVVLGWKKGVFLHNILILSAFLMIGLVPIIRSTWMLAWPQLLILPAGLFQIWQVQNISEGKKPNWLLLKITAIFLFVACLYMLLFALFTH